MSRSEAAAGLRRLADQVEQDAALDEHAVRRLVSATARLYAQASEETEITALDEDVSPTEAVMLASALLRARDLNPFDLAVWFSRSTPPR